MAIEQDFGADQATTEQAKIAVNAVPGLPGKVEILFHACDAINDKVDSYDTVDGRPHSAGRSRSSNSFKARIYMNRKVEVAALDAWAAAARVGKKGYQATIIVTYLFADGSAARALRLTGSWPKMRTDPAMGETGAAVVEYEFVYHRSEPLF